jgi:hypothetical protein
MTLNVKHNRRREQALTRIERVAELLPGRLREALALLGV